MYSAETTAGLEAGDIYEKSGSGVSWATFVGLSVCYILLLATFDTKCFIIFRTIQEYVN